MEPGVPGVDGYGPLHRLQHQQVFLQVTHGGSMGCSGVIDTIFAVLLHCMFACIVFKRLLSLVLLAFYWVEITQ